MLEFNLPQELRRQADEIAYEGHNGWGNLDLMAADEIDRLRAELSTERKRQSAMRTLITSLENTLSHYRSKQDEADEAIRTLDSERAANAALTAELAACREAFARQTEQLEGAQNEARHFRNIVHRLDAARKGEGDK